MKDRLTRHWSSERKTAELGRFVVVGVVNTLFSYVIYSLLIFCGIRFELANIVALALGILFSFKTQGQLVFRNSKNRRFPRFLLLWTLIYGINVFMISEMMMHGLNAYVGGALAIPPVTVLSYLGQKFFVFRRDSGRTTAS